MKKRIAAMMFIVVMSVIFAGGCGEAETEKTIEETILTTEAKTETTNEASTDQTIAETTEAASIELVHVDAIWENTNVGPLYFEAPVSTTSLRNISLVSFTDHLSNKLLSRLLTISIRPLFIFLSTFENILFKFFSII